MRVLLIGNYEPDAQRSMNAYCDVLHRTLVHEGVQVSVSKPSRVFGGGRSGAKKWLSYIDKFVVYPVFLAIKSFSYDRVHVCDHSNAMYVWMIFWKKWSVTCHDVIAIQAAFGAIPGWSVSWSGRLFQRLILSGLQKAKKVICVSELTRRDLSHLIADQKDVCVVSNPLNYDFYPDHDADIVLKRIRPDLFGKPFVLYVGSALPRKNRPFVVELWLRLRDRNEFSDMNLVVVGPNLDDQLKLSISKAGADAFLFNINWVDGEGLRALYSKACFFVFPSLNEGFGWPVAEAQACGCPVFASSREPMPEVGGGGARYFDPESVDDAVTVITASDMSEMKRQGLENSLRFRPGVFGLRMKEEIYDL